MGGWCGGGAGGSKKWCGAETGRMESIMNPVGSAMKILQGSHERLVGDVYPSHRGWGKRRDGKGILKQEKNTQIKRHEL